MAVDIRDSSSLKPAELDVLSQVLRDAGSPLDDKALDQQVESFSRVSLVVAEDEEVAAQSLAAAAAVGAQVTRVRPGHELLSALAHAGGAGLVESGGGPRPGLPDRHAVGETQGLGAYPML